MKEYENTLSEYQELVDNREQKLTDKQETFNGKTMTRGYKDFISKTQELENNKVNRKPNQKKGTRKP